MAATWAGKRPEDMSMDELQEAKTVLQQATIDAQDRLNWLSSANNHVGAEVAKRFALNNAGFPDPTSLPDYPLVQVGQAYGTSAKAQ
jgi:hypothetical protein